MSQNNTISWSKDYFLDWSDFQAEFNPAALEDVHSIIKYRYTWIVNSESDGNQIRFFIENIDLIAEFYPLLSWVRHSEATPKLLKHEQGHFDLENYFGPKLQNKFRVCLMKKNFQLEDKIKNGKNNLLVRILV